MTSEEEEKKIIKQILFFHWDQQRVRIICLAIFDATEHFLWWVRYEKKIKKHGRLQWLRGKHRGQICMLMGRGQKVVKRERIVQRVAYKIHDGATQLVQGTCPTISSVTAVSFMKSPPIRIQDKPATIAHCSPFFFLSIDVYACTLVKPICSFFCPCSFWYE